MPLSGFLDSITGANSVRQSGREAKQAARARFNPSQLSPQLANFQRMATEGMGRAEDIQREGAVASLFREQAQPLGGSSREMAMRQQMTEGRQQALSDFERGLSQQDVQIREQGQAGFAQTRSQQGQLEAQRDAALSEIDMQTQAEIDRRRQALGGTVGSLAGTLAGASLGPLGAAAVGGAAGGIFGGGSGALTGAATGATTAVMNDMMTPEGETVTDTVTDGVNNRVDAHADFFNMADGMEQIPENQVTQAGNFLGITDVMETVNVASAIGRGQLSMDLINDANKVLDVDETMQENLMNMSEGELASLQNIFVDNGAERDVPMEPTGPSRDQLAIDLPTEPTQNQMETAEALFNSDEGKSLQLDLATEMMRLEGSVNETAVDYLSSLLTGYDTEGERTTPFNVSEILQTPFRAGYQGISKLDQFFGERREANRQQAIQNIMARKQLEQR